MNGRRRLLLGYQTRRMSWWRNPTNASQKTLDRIAAKAEKEN